MSNSHNVVFAGSQPENSDNGPPAGVFQVRDESGNTREIYQSELDAANNYAELQRQEQQKPTITINRPERLVTQFDSNRPAEFINADREIANRKAHLKAEMERVYDPDTKQPKPGMYHAAKLLEMQVDSLNQAIAFDNQRRTDYYANLQSGGNGNNGDGSNAPKGSLAAEAIQRDQGAYADITDRFAVECTQDANGVTTVSIRPRIKYAGNA